VLLRYPLCSDMPNRVLLVFSCVMTSSVTQQVRRYPLKISGKLQALSCGGLSALPEVRLCPTGILRDAKARHDSALSASWSLTAHWNLVTGYARFGEPPTASMSRSSALRQLSTKFRGEAKHPHKEQKSKTNTYRQP
jgi:hypothetical protein